MSNPPAAESAHTGGRGASRGIVLRVARVAVAAGLLAALLWVVPAGEVARALCRARLLPLLLSVLLVFAAMLLSALKLWLLVQVGFPRAGLGAVLRAYYIGAFFNNFLPTSIGGDAVKLHELCRAGVPLRHAAASIVVERSSGLLVVLVLGAVVSLGFGGLLGRLKLEVLRWPLAAAGVAALVAPALLYLTWRARAKSFLRARRERRPWGWLYSTAEGFFVFRNRPRVVLCAIGLSAAFYGLIALNMAVVAYALGKTISPWEAVGILPLRTLPDLLPVSVGSLGVREGAIAYCLSGLGLEPVRAAAVALALRMVGWAHSAVGGILFGFGAAGAREPARAGR